MSEIDIRVARVARPVHLERPARLLDASDEGSSLLE